MTTITSNATGVYLSSGSFTNPITIATGVTVTGNATASGFGIYSFSGPWTITNAGTVEGAGTHGTGIYLYGGGSVTNLAGAFIGNNPTSTGAALVIGTKSGGVGTVVNAGIIDPGVWLWAGGSVTNQSGGKITGYSSTGGYGVGFYTGGTLTNAGQISGGLAGVDASHYGAVVTNQSGGTIHGHYFGVLMVIADQPTAGVRSVINLAGGTITGNVGFEAGGDKATVVNAGVIAGTVAGTTVARGYTLVTGAGVTFASGGSVTNQSGGSIIGATFGVYIGGGAGTVVNAGTIGGTSAAVLFAPGQANRLVVDPGAVFTGLVSGGNSIGSTVASTLELASGASAGTLSGIGSQYIDFANVTVDAGASWTLTGSNTILSGAELYDSGTLTNTGTFDGIVQLTGGTVINVSGGTISGDPAAVYGPSGASAGTVINAGVMVGGSNPTRSAGIALLAGGYVSNASTGRVSAINVGIYIGNAVGTVVNAGTATGTGTHSNGVELGSGGLVSNAASGTITATNNGVLLDQPGLLVNQGFIGVGASGSSGAYLSRGGSVANTGIIQGGSFGVQFGGSATTGGTVTNAGTIAGSFDAVSFQPGQVNRLIVDPGASFIGTVDGADPIASTIVSTLELASGASAGTLSGIGTQFIGFGQVTVDAGASWLLTGSNTVLTGVTLTNSGTVNGEVSVASGGLVVNQTGGTLSTTATVAAAVYGSGGPSTVTNAGLISTTNDTIAAVALTAGGTVVNTGSIGGAQRGVQFKGSAGTLINFGIITNSSTHADVGLIHGGSITNASGGLIQSSNGTAIYGTGASISVVNAGSIGATGTGGNGVKLQSGGSVTNAVGGTISSGGYSPIYILGGVGTVNNAGLIVATSTGGTGVHLQAGGSVTNASGGTISAVALSAVYFGGTAGTVDNAGLIVSTGNGPNDVALDLHFGGLVTNESSGTLSGVWGFGAHLGPATLINYGTVASTTTHAAAFFEAGGSLTNASGGMILSTGGGAIYATNASLAVLNAGIIQSGSTSSSGLFLKGGGTVTNTSSGTISGNAGVYASVSAVNVVNLGSIHGNGVGIGLRSGGTVTNAGAISGGADAVHEYAGFANRVIIDPGASFTGIVDGGNIIGSSIVSTLELASGASVGTLTSFGTKYIDFAQIVVDSGANWTIAGNGTLASGQTLTNNGTLTETGAFVVSGALTNSAQLTGTVALGSGGSFTNTSGGTVVGSGLAAVKGTTTGLGTVVNYGVIDPAIYGVYLPSGGLVTNATGALIEGTQAGVLIEGGTGTVINSGSIAGLSAGSAGVILAAGGSVVNNLGGTISGAVVGVSIAGGGTFTNAGSVYGGVYGSKFAPGYTNRLIIFASGHRTGIADGGNTIGASAVSTLELASAAATGTFAAFGSTFVNFAQVTIDSGAAWTVGGTDSFAAGVTLTNGGTLFDNRNIVDNGLIDSRAGTVIVGSSAGFNGTLEVDAGGTFDIGVAGTNPALFIGNAGASGTLAASTGTVLVTGTGAALNAYAPILIAKGTAATGLLEIAQGATGQVSTSSETVQAALGIGLNGFGTFVVTDPGSVFTAHGQVVVGRAGTGTLLVENQGTLILANDGSGNAPALQIGSGSGTNAAQVGGSGTGTVTGGGAIDGGSTTSVIQIGGNGDTGALTVNNGIVQSGTIKLGNATTIGGTVYTGSGVLNIGTGGLAEALGTAGASVVIGQNAGSSGTVAVNGGTLVSGNQIIVGNQSLSTGLLTIGSAGTVQVNAAGLVVGNSTGATGTVLVAGGTLADTGFFGIGGSGTGSMTISAGGTVASTQLAGPAGDIGVLSGSHGTVVVTGTQSAWQVNGQLVIGDAGSGSLDVNTKAIVNAGTNLVDIGNQNGGAGIVSVESGGTLLGGNLNIDTPISGTASGLLAIGAGGSVGVTNVAVGGGGTITLGGTSASVLSSTQAVTIGQSGTSAALLAIGQGGTVSFGSGGTIGLFQIAPITGSNGTVTVNGGTLTGSQLNVDSQSSGVATALLSVGAGGVVSVTGLDEGSGGTIALAGTAETAGGRALLTDTGLLSIGQTGTTNALLTIGQFATVTDTGNLAIGINAGNQGTVAVNGGVLNASAVNIATPLTGTATGLLSVNAGGLASVANIAEGAGGIIIVGGTTGAAATLTSSGGIGVGVSGIGALLTVNQTGTLIDSGGLSVALSAGTGGTVVVNGGSVNGGALSIGGNGAGTLIVDAGGVLIANNGTQGSNIGSGTGGSGTMIVDGGTVHVTGPFFGVGGTNSAAGLLVENNGQLVTGIDNNNISVGGDINGTGTGVATGSITSGGTWTTTGNLIVGDTGFGSLDINGNGLVSTGTLGITIGQQTGSTGTLTVENGGTLIGGYLVAANNSGSDLLAIGAGGYAQVTSLNAGTGGTITVGGTTAAFLGVAGYINIGQSGTGTGYLSIGSGGTVATNGTGLAINAVNVGEYDIGFGLHEAGTLAVNGGTLSDSGDLTVSDGLLTVSNGGIVTLAASSALNFSTGGIGGPGAFSLGTVVVNGGTITGGQYLADRGFFDVSGGGTVSFNGGTASAPTSVGNGSQGTLIVDGGSFSETGSSFDVGVYGEGVLVVENGGLLTTTNANGAVISAGGTVLSTGVSTGTVNNATWVENGALTIGADASSNGSLDINGNGLVNAGTNSVTIGDSGGSGALTAEGGGILIAGSLTVADGNAGSSGLLSIVSGGTVAVTSVNVGNGGTIMLSGGLLDPPTGITLNAGGTITGFGTIDGSLFGNGTVIATGGLLDITGPVNGSGGLSIAAGATLELDGGVAASETVAFTPTSGTIVGGILQIANIGFSGTIDEFLQRDSLILAGITDVSTITAVGTVLDIHQSSGPDILLNLDPIRDYASGTFNFFTSGGNTVITDNVTPCYLAGTMIRTDRGEVLVEQLAIGDRVVTLDGTSKAIKWIGRRAYSSAFAAGNRDVIPILIRQGALGDRLPVRDLYISPLHAMYLNDVLVPAEHLVNGVSIVRCPHIDPIRYFHIELENHDVIFADGAPAETFVDCDSRGIFHNAIEFAELYPNAQERAWAFCAPRIESGPVLDAIRADIDARAGLIGSVTSELMGRLDGLDGNTITGWAFDPATPDTPVTLEVLDGDGSIARVTANRYRSDLEAAGIGDGRCGFELRLSRPLSPTTRHELRVRRVGDRHVLDGCPLIVEPRDRGALLRDVRQMVAGATTGTPDPATMDALLDTFMSGIDHIRRLRLAQNAATQDGARLLRWARGPRQQPKRALIVDDRLPRRDGDAAAIALLSQISALRGLGWDIEIVASDELARGDDAVQVLTAWGVTVHRAPVVSSVEEVLRRKRAMFDMVYLHRLPNAEAYAALVRIWQPKARVVLGIDAPPAQSQRVVTAMRMADATIVGSAAEVAFLARAVPDAAVYGAAELEAVLGSGAAAVVAQVRVG